MDDLLLKFDRLSLPEKSDFLIAASKKYPELIISRQNAHGSNYFLLSEHLKSDALSSELNKYSKGIDFLSHLTSDVVPIVLQFLDGFTLLKCRCVSRGWHSLLEKDDVNFIWQREFQRIFSRSRGVMDAQSASENKDNTKCIRWIDMWNGQLENRRVWLSLANLDESTLNKWDFIGHTDRVRHVRIRGNTFVSASWDGTVRVGNTSKLGDMTKTVVRHHGSVFGIWFDGRVVASCSEDHTVVLFDVIGDRQLAELKGHTKSVYRIDLLSTKKPYFSGTSNTNLSDIPESIKAAGLEKYANTLLVSCSGDFIGVWDWVHEVLVRKLTGHTHDVHRLQINDNYIVTGSYDETIRIWRYAEDEFESIWNSPPWHRGGVSALHVVSSPNERLVGSGSAHGDIFIYDINQRKLVFRNNNTRKAVSLTDQTKRVVTCVYLDLRTRLFICCSILSFYSGAGQVCLWDIDTGVCNKVIKQSSYINSLKYEFALLFSAESDGCVRIRDLARKDVPLVREEKLSKGQLFDVDVQGQAMVACGLDRVFLLRPLFQKIKHDNRSLEHDAVQSVGDLEKVSSSSSANDESSVSE